MKECRLSSACDADTQTLAATLARALNGGEILFLRGPIGAGKTVFVKGLARALGLTASPTSASFSLFKAYQNKKYRLFHLDLFRLEEGELFNLGFEEILEDEQAIVVVEWPDRAGTLIPANAKHVRFVYGAAETGRVITVDGMDGAI